MSDVPTNSFRFVRRTVTRPSIEAWPLNETYTAEILQQLFWINGGQRSEWRDLPVVDEEPRNDK